MSEDLKALVEAGRRMSPRLDMLDCETVLQMADAIEAEVHAEAWAAALEAAAELLDGEAKYHRELAVAQYGSGIPFHENNNWAARKLFEAGKAVRAMITDDAIDALDRIKAEARAEGMLIGAAREKMRVLTEWINEDEDNGEILMASLDGDTIETLRAILAAIPVTK